MSGKVGNPQATLFGMFLESLIIDPKSLKGIDLESSSDVRSATQSSVIMLMNRVKQKGNASCLKSRISEAHGLLEILGHHHPKSPEFQAATTIAEYVSAHTRKTLPRKFPGKRELMPSLRGFRSAGQLAEVSAS